MNSGFFVCTEVVEMFTPNIQHLTSSGDVIDDILARRPRCHVRDETGSSILPPVYEKFSELAAVRNSRLYNSFLSVLAAADALCSSASTPLKTFPFPVDEMLPGTISGYCPVSRSPVTLMQRQIPHNVDQRQLSRFGIKGSSDLSHFCRAMLCISAAYAVARCLAVCPSVRLSHSCILSKRINVSSNLSLFGSRTILVFSYQTL